MLGVRIPPPKMTCTFLIQLVFTSGHQSVTSILSGAPLLKKNPGSAPEQFGIVVGKERNFASYELNVDKGRIITVTINRMLVRFSDFLMNSCEASLSSQADDCGEMSYQRTREQYRELRTGNLIL